MPSAAARNRKLRLFGSFGLGNCTVGKLPHGKLSLGKSPLEKSPWESTITSNTLQIKCHLKLHLLRIFLKITSNQLKNKLAYKKKNLVHLKSNFYLTDPTL